MSKYQALHIAVMPPGQKKWRKKYGPLLLDAEAASLRYGRGSGANDSCPTKENPPANENKPAENLSAKESLASKENRTAKENPRRLLTPSQPPRCMLASQDSSLARDFANAREILVKQAWTPFWHTFQC
jgi:hypothetical protein